MEILKLDLSHKSLVNPDIDRFINLTILDLSFNCISNINLDNLTKLQELKLNNNKLCQFSCNLPNLHILDLSNNSIQSVNLNLPNLQDLNLSYNLISKINICRQLIKANLTYNRIDSITGEFNNLEWLDISHNNLIELPNEMPNLQLLNASYNELTTIPNINACTIYLFNNLITEANLDSFSNLKQLGLSGNQITSINIKNPNLTHLYLADNFLKELEINNLQFLQILYVQGNQLTSIKLTNLPSLYALYIFENKIELLPESITLLRNLYDFIFHANPIKNLDELAINEFIKYTKRIYNPYAHIKSASFFINLKYISSHAY